MWAVLVPEALAYATIAGVSPVVGLYAAPGALILYAALGTAAVLVLRAMSRRWREAGSAEDVASPYGPAGAQEATP